MELFMKNVGRLFILVSFLSLSSCFIANAMDPSSLELRRDKIDKEDLGNQLVEDATSGNLKEVKKLIADGADVDYKSHCSWTPLIKAAMYDHQEVVTCLIDASADVNAKDKYGKTALFWAAQRGYHLIVECLIKAGADINERDNDGCTALMFASKNGRDLVIQSLIAHNANVYAQDNIGMTALRNAAEYGSQPCCELLIDCLMQIPSHEQRKKLYTFLLCLKQWNVSHDIQRYFKPFLLAAIEEENREYPELSLAYQEMQKIRNKDRKKKLLEKYWPKQSTSCVIL